MISKYWIFGLFWVPLVAAFARADAYDPYFQKKSEWYAVLSQKNISQEALRQKQDQADKELSPLLRSLIGDTQFRESPKSKRVQPEDRGAGTTDTGCVDAMSYEFQSSAVVTVSDEEIIKRWALFWKEKLKSPFGLKELSIYSTDFACRDARHTTMGELNLSAQKGFDDVYGTMALVAQDIGPLSPNAIDMYARKGKKLIFMTFEVDAAQTELQKCHQLWTDANPKGIAEEESVFKRMTECYQESFPRSALQEHFRKLAEERFSKLF